RARVDLVVDEVVQLHHVDVTDRHLAIERLAGAPVVKRHLARVIEPGEIEHLLDVGLLGAVEDRRCNRHAVTQVGSELDQLLLAQRLDGLGLAIDLLERILERAGIAFAVISTDRLPDPRSESGASPAEMGLQDLSHVHSAGNAQRIEHDVDRRAVFEERHVLGGHDLRHDTLIAMTAGHLVARLDLSLHGDEDFHPLHYARRGFVAALQLLDLVEEALFEPLLRLVVLFADGLNLGHQLVVRRGELPPLRAGILLEHRTGDLGILLEALRASYTLAALQHLGQTAVDVAIEDRLLVVAVLGEPLDLLALDGQRTLVFLDAVTVEHAHLDHRPLDTGRHAQRGIAHVGGLFAEDRAQQLLLRRHRAFALRRDLAAKNVAGAYLGPDVDD